MSDSERAHSGVGGPVEISPCGPLGSDHVTFRAYSGGSAHQRAYKIFIIGVRNFIVEVDARYIRGMLNNPDIAPSASINCWIVSILTFHFELRHVPGKQHGPDGLSRRPPQPGDLLEEEDDPEEFNDWVDNLYGFTHLINPSLPATRSASFLFTLASQLATL